MATEQDHARALTPEELDVVSGGAAARFSMLSQQSFLARLDWVTLNPQPLPPRILHPIF